MYDQENRLIRILNPDGTRSTYTYAGDTGFMRTQQEPGATVITLIWEYLVNGSGQWSLRASPTAAPVPIPREPHPM